MNSLKSMNNGGERLAVVSSHSQERSRVVGLEFYFKYLALWFCVPNMGSLIVALLLFVASTALTGFTEGRAANCEWRKLNSTRVLAIFFSTGVVGVSVLQDGTTHFVYCAFLASVILFVLSGFGSTVSGIPASRKAIWQLRACATGSVCWSGLVFVNYLRGQTSYDYINSVSTDVGSRYGALSLDPNFTAAIICASLSIYVCTRSYLHGLLPTTPLKLSASRFGNITVYVLVFLSAAVALVLTASRLGVIVVAILVLSQMVKKWFVPLLASPVLLFKPDLVSGFLNNVPALAKVSGMEAGDGKSDDLRIRIWKQGFSIVDEYKIVGLGWGRGGVANIEWLGRPISFHSSFLTLAIDVGLLLASICAAIYCFAMLKLLLSYRRVSHVTLVLVYALLNSVISFVYASGPAFAVLIAASVFIDHKKELKTNNA